MSSSIVKLVAELKQIEVECLGDSTEEKKRDKSDKKLDAYQIAKRDLTALLKETKENINKRNEFVRKTGSSRDENAIRMRTENARHLQACRKHLDTMKNQLTKDQVKADKGKKSALPKEELDTRKELLDLLEKDVAYAESIHAGGGKGGEEGGRKGHNIARNARDARRRQKERDAGNGAVDSGDIEMDVPQLTRQEQLFIEESNKRDQEIDEKLDLIHHGVKQLGRMAEDINTELRVQEGMLDQVEDKMDNVIQKYETANMRMNKLLDSSGGVSRWCPLIIAGVILLALLAYIYNISQFSP